MAQARNHKPKEQSDTAIPRFIIDLSLRPEDRYVALAKRYRPQIQRLASLFDELLLDFGIPFSFHRSINRAARLLLRRVHSPIETAELRGISKAGGISMYLLVALNLVLDLLMGCTSGAVRAREEGQELAEARMLHFRTLDWGMDPLRAVVVQLDFIRSTQSTTAVLGTTMTYVGFVGILTGVRKDLSLSLNFRAVHDASTKIQQFRFYFHHILVLFGLRQSISSLLRSCLFGHDREWAEKPKTLEAIKATIPIKHTTSAYLIFCDGKGGLSMEKDFSTAVMRESGSFVVTTNHDLQPHRSSQGKSTPKTHATAMRELLEESEDRRDSVVRKWHAKLRKEWRARESTVKKTTSVRMTTRSMTSGNGSFDGTAHQDSVDAAYEAASHRYSVLESIEQNTAVSKQELIGWTKSWPTTNERTHFAAILDPSTGQVLWAQRYIQPIQSPADDTPRIELDCCLEQH